MQARYYIIALPALLVSSQLSGSLGPCCGDHALHGEPGDSLELALADMVSVRGPTLLTAQAGAASQSASNLPLAHDLPSDQDASNTASSVNLTSVKESDTAAHHCLSLNVYWEARNQSVAGQIAVAQVTVNRARDPRYPTDICEVVYDHKQFSWYWDGKSDWPVELAAWELSKLVASAALAGTGHAQLQGVTHYHAVYIQPYWRDSMTLVATIGDHIFYSDSPQTATAYSSARMSH